MGSSKKQTVGYKYYVGMHLILCHGQADNLREIRVDDKVAWNGANPGGRITLNKPNLFGGEKREGGISGPMDFVPGSPVQTPNDYLQAKLPGGLVPAFRGVAAAVLRQVYVGLNPYLKYWKFRLQRIGYTSAGAPQWYREKAPIGSLFGQPAAIFMAIDTSGSMALGSPTRLSLLKTALNSVLDELAESLNSTVPTRIDIQLVSFASTVKSTITRRSLTVAGVAELKAWVSGLSAGGGTNFEAAVQGAPSFFSGSPADLSRVSVFLSDGEANEGNSAAGGALLLGIADLQAYAFNFVHTDTSQSALYDNTPVDGVPVIASGDSDALAAAFRLAISGQLDMNPAHIIRECLTDPLWGMGYQSADMGASFAAAADVLYGERFGLSLLWDGQMPIEEFVGEVVRTIDAALYVDRQTGLFELKLIRDDYDEEALATLGPDEVLRVENYKRSSLAELTNSVTVNYVDPLGNTASVTAHDPALIQMQGAVVGTTIQYPGITCAALAGRVAERDLKALSTPLLTCTLYANRAAAGFNVGDVFKFEYPKFHDGYVVMRITGMAFGDGRSNVVRLDCSQDAFAMPQSAAVVAPGGEWEDPAAAPDVSPFEAVAEAPYYELVQAQGQEAVDAALAEDPDVGYFLAAAVRPTGAINAALYVDAGEGYEDVGIVDFAPVATLAAAVGYADTVWSVTGGQELDEVVVGSFGQVGDELVRIDAVDEEAGTITVGRGVLDTTPSPHAAGSLLLCWDGYASSDERQYATAETVNVKILPVSGSGMTDLAVAPVNAVTMAQRAFRPYPPGRLTFNGEMFPASLEADSAGEVLLEWVHRNRVQQTGGELLDFTDAGVTPEAGTTYKLDVRDAVSLVQEFEAAGIALSYLLDEATLAGMEDYLEFRLWAVRDGLESWQPVSAVVKNPYSTLAWEPWSEVWSFTTEA